MEDTREVSAELHRLADAAPTNHFDTATVLTRGHRGLRRRRFLGVGGTIAGVAAAALAVTLIPNLTGTGNGDDPGVAATQTENSQFSPVPGVPRGEDGAGQRISKQEAERRCALRYPDAKKSLTDGTGFRSVSSHSYDLKSGQQKGGGVVLNSSSPFFCMIPGGDKPSAALVAAAKADPLPKNEADQLRNCSVNAWVDMTKWHIVVSDRLALTEKNYRGFSREMLIAVSPSGKTAIACQLPVDVVRGAGFGWGVTALRLDDLGTDYPRIPWPDGTQGKEIAAILPEGTDCNGNVCGRSLPTGWGQAPANTAKVVVQIGSGPAYESPLKDGWFTFTVMDKHSHTNAEPLKVRAYDKDGKLLSKLYPEK
ncbi:hypothetical protein AB0L70_19990 [Kribbella sp. NPDC051952]|uniref:hypothetical protein n=1 Tax=Kribbella sp. NPDC051952 TaxID=3154851 RepID=UPI00341B7995